MDWSHIKALPRPKDERDFLIGSVSAPASIPASYIPAISWLVRNFQGQTPFCGEHAGTHFEAILKYAASNGATITRKNPRYGSIKLKNPKSSVCDGYAIDAGTDMRSIFKWLSQVGADDFDPLENDVTLPLAQYCEPSVVTPDMDANAGESLISSYAFGNTDYESLCQYIYAQKAVLLLIKCDDGFWGKSVPTFTTPTYGHFIVAFGYDAEGIYVIDSAEPNDAFAIKHVLKQYLTPEFILESGTAVALPASVKAVLTDPTIPAATKPQLIQTILQDIEQALGLVQKELGQL